MTKPTAGKRPTMTMQLQREKALARWEGEGGAGPEGPQGNRAHVRKLGDSSSRQGHAPPANSTRRMAAAPASPARGRDDTAPEPVANRQREVRRP